MVSYIKKIFRISDWWAHILPPIALFYYLGCIILKSNTAFSELAFFSIMLWGVITALLGFFVNDYFDIALDKAAGKENKVSELPHYLQLIIPISFSIILYLNLYLVNLTILQKKYAFIVLISNLFLFIIYAMPPLRLKNNSYFALFIDAMYSGTFFYILAILIVLQSELCKLPLPIIIFVILTFLWSITKGTRNYLNHLIADFEYDKASKIKTLAISKGKEWTEKCIKKIFIFEFLFFVCLICSLKNYMPTLLLLFDIFFVAFLFYKTKNSLTISKNDYYEIWMPIVVLLYLVYEQPNKFPLLIIHTLLFPQYLNKIYFYTIFKAIGPIRKKHDKQMQ